MTEIPKPPEDRFKGWCVQCESERWLFMCPECNGAYCSGCWRGEAHTIAHGTGESSTSEGLFLSPSETPPSTPQGEGAEVAPGGPTEVPSPQISLFNNPKNLLYIAQVMHARAKGLLDACEQLVDALTEE